MQPHKGHYMTMLDADLDPLRNWVNQSLSFSTESEEFQVKPNLKRRASASRSGS